MQMNFRIIAYIVGWVCNFQAMFMVLPCITALIYQEHEFFASAIVRRNKIRKYDQEELSETAKLIKQYRGIAHDAGYNIFSILEKAVRDSIPDESKPKDRKLSYKYVHKLVRETLALC